jgi:hypothetical protein
MVQKIRNPSFTGWFSYIKTSISMGFPRISPCFLDDFPAIPQEALPLGLCGASTGASTSAVVSGTVRVTLSDVTEQQLQVVTWLVERQF